MTDGAGAHDLNRHERVVTVAVLSGASAMVVFRAMIELGFAPTGSLRVAGVPLEYPWLAWFLAIWALRSNRQKASGAARLRLTAYEWWLGILSLAGTMWLVQELGTFRRIGAAAWPYWVASGCALAVFLSAASTERPRNLALSRNALPDFLRILGRPVTWVRDRCLHHSVCRPAIHGDTDGGTRVPAMVLKPSARDGPFG